MVREAVSDGLSPLAEEGLGMGESGSARSKGREVLREALTLVIRPARDRSCFGV
jgi:hypothetical protein